MQALSPPAAVPVPSGPPDDEERRLVLRARNGDMDAFAAIYRRHVGRIHGLCRRLTADPGLAEELTQEAFVRAWQKLHLYGGDAPFGAWLRTLAANVVWSDRRSRRFRLRLVPMDEAPRAAEGAPPLPQHAVDLEKAISRLPAKARCVFVLHDVEGYHHDEIAAITRTTVGTSKAHLHRARQLLRRDLTR